MTREYFDNNVIMAVEIESDYGGRYWETIKGSEVKDYLNNLSEDDGVSDIDYCTEQEDPEIREIIDKAGEIFWSKDNQFKSFNEAVNSLLDEAPSKKVWTEEEIKNLVQTNDKVLYGALKKLYACQTDEEQCDGTTHELNGKGFNGVDAPILSSFCEFLNKAGFLTPKQKAVARKKLVKYNKQLTLLANA